MPNLMAAGTLLLCCDSVALLGVRRERLVQPCLGTAARGVLGARSTAFLFSRSVLFPNTQIRY